MSSASGTMYDIPKQVPCKRCGADCIEDFTWEVKTATNAVMGAWGNGANEACAYLAKLEATIVCRDCVRLIDKEKKKAERDKRR